MLNVFTQKNKLEAKEMSSATANRVYPEQSIVCKFPSSSPVGTFNSPIITLINPEQRTLTSSLAKTSCI